MNLCTRTNKEREESPHALCREEKKKENWESGGEWRKGVLSLGRNLELVLHDTQRHFLRIVGPLHQ